MGSTVGFKAGLNNSSHSFNSENYTLRTSATYTHADYTMFETLEGGVTNIKYITQSRRQLTKNTETRILY